jgi:signal transduction histidine kinase
MMRLIQKLWPSSLIGQLLLVAAIALLLAQAANTAMLVAGTRAQAALEASSILVARVANQIERRRPASDFEGRQGRGRFRQSLIVSTQDAPLQATGFRSSAELTDRASEFLLSADPDIQAIQFSVGPISGLPTPLQQAVRQRSGGGRFGAQRGGRPEDAVFMTLKTGDGSWISAAAYIRPIAGRPIFLLLMQTAILYLAVLIPLALIARRITRPLRTLTARVQQSGLAEPASILTPQGPSDVRDLIEAFNTAQSRLSALLTEKDVMLGAIGHDLKTPLASLRVRIESVEDDGERDKMAATVEEMTAILDDILMLARLGKSAEPAIATDMAALVETVISEFPEDAKIQHDQAGGRHTAPIRPILLKRAIRNLVANALQYGGNANLRRTADADYVRLLVEDDGPGIAEDQIAKMFEPFARAETSRSRQHGGTGLGLTIARAIAQAHGGGLMLENRAEGGLRAILSVKA